MKFSIVTPCYNESENLIELCQRFSKISEKMNLELIIVNNGSTDNSKDLLKEIAESYKFLRVVDVKINRGYGHGIIQGLNACSGDFIGWTHADLQTDPEDIYRAALLIMSCADKNIFVKGSRRGRPLLDTFLSGCMSLFVTALFGRCIYEINAQPNIFPKNFYTGLKNIPQDFSIDLFFYTEALKRKLPIKRITTLFPSRKAGASKWNKGPLSVVRFIITTMKFSLLRRVSYKK